MESTSRTGYRRKRFEKTISAGASKEEREYALQIITQQGKWNDLSLEMGNAVTFDKTLVRRCLNATRYYWAVKEHPTEVFEGIYIGWRCLTNGWVSDSMEYNSEDSFRVAFVVFHPNKNPVYVPFCNLSLVNKHD